MIEFINLLFHSKKKRFMLISRSNRALLNKYHTKILKF